jgi:predicted transcriptional regulator
MVFQRISPPDSKGTLTPHDLSHVIVRRLGLKRKESRAEHAQLLLELLKYRKENVPVSIEKISEVLNVSQSQTYEEIRKWRSLGLIEFVKIPAGDGFLKGYMLTGQTVNRLLDKAEASAKSFFRKTRRIAKDFDDLLMLGMARDAKGTGAEEEAVKESESAEDEENG